MGPASRSARIKSVQSRGRAVQAMKSGATGADRQLVNARKRVKATETTTNNRTTTKDQPEVDAQGRRISVDRATKISRQKLISGKKTSKNDTARLRAANMLGPKGPVTSETPKNHKALAKHAAETPGLSYEHYDDGKVSIVNEAAGQTANYYADGKWSTMSRTGEVVHQGDGGMPVFGPGRKVRGRTIPTSH
jgi:hypothetical protein